MQKILFFNPRPTNVTTYLLLTRNLALKYSKKPRNFNYALPATRPLMTTVPKSLKTVQNILDEKLEKNAVNLVDKFLENDFKIETKILHEKLSAVKKIEIRNFQDSEVREFESKAVGDVDTFVPDFGSKFVENVHNLLDRGVGGPDFSRELEFLSENFYAHIKSCINKVSTDPYKNIQAYGRTLHGSVYMTSFKGENIFAELYLALRCGLLDTVDKILDDNSEFFSTVESNFYAKFKIFMKRMNSEKRVFTSSESLALSPDSSSDGFKDILNAIMHKSMEIPQNITSFEDFVWLRLISSKNYKQEILKLENLELKVFGLTILKEYDLVLNLICNSNLNLETVICLLLKFYKNGIFEDFVIDFVFKILENLKIESQNFLILLILKNSQIQISQDINFTKNIKNDDFSDQNQKNTDFSQNLKILDEKKSTKIIKKILEKKLYHLIKENSILPLQLLKRIHKLILNTNSPSQLLSMEELIDFTDNSFTNLLLEEIKCSILSNKEFKFKSLLNKTKNLKVEIFYKLKLFQTQKCMISFKNTIFSNFDERDSVIKKYKIELSYILEVLIYDIVDVIKEEGDKFEARCFVDLVSFMELKGVYCNFVSRELINMI